MRDYIQENRRAGRDGLKNKAIIIQAQQIVRDRKRVKEQGWKVDKLMKEFILGKNCRRIALDKEIDKINKQTNRIGCEIGEERCNIYKGNLKGTKKKRVVVEN